MESKKELYKARKKGLGDRGVRARLKGEESRAGRENLLLAKRNIAPSESPESKKTIEKNSKDRLQMLKEWQQKRAEERKKEQISIKKKKVFVSAVSAKTPLKTTAAPNTSFSASSVHCSKASITDVSAKPPQPKKPSDHPAKVSITNVRAKPSHSRPGLTAKNSSITKTATASATGPATTRSKALSTSSTMSTRAVKPANSKSSNLKSIRPPVKKVDTLRRARQKSPHSSKPSTRKSPLSKKNSVTQSSTRNSGQKVSCASKGGKSVEKPNSASKSIMERRPVTRNSSSKKPTSGRKNLERNTAKGSTNKNPASPELQSETVSPSPTPIAPAANVHPSPCYVTTRPNSQISHIGYPIPFLSDPAWIPGAEFGTPKGANFTEEFGSPLQAFSPFQFSGGAEDSNKRQTPGKPYKFTFRKSVSVTPKSLLKDALRPQLNMSSDSLNDSLHSTQSHTPYMESSLVNHSMRSCNTPSSRAPEGDVYRVVDTEQATVLEVVPDKETEASDKSEVSPTVSSSSSQECEDSSTQDSSSDEKKEESAIDFAYFRRIHAEVVERFNSLCSVWDEKLEGLEETTEENVLGQIRTTIGQVQLLIQQKLKQYLSLVEGAENGGQITTTAEDLQGFWDMVFFQVEDIYRKFDALSELEKNGWKEESVQPRTRSGKKRQTRSSTKSASSSSEASDRLQAQREKRAEARNRLREMKEAARRARKQEEEEKEEEEEEVMIALPKKSKIDSLQKKTPSKSRKSKTPSKPPRRSVCLIDFDSIVTHSPKMSVISESMVSNDPFSPTVRAVNTEENCSETVVPTAELLFLSPKKTPKAKTLFKKPKTPLRRSARLSTSESGSDQDSNQDGGAVLSPKKTPKAKTSFKKPKTPLRRSARLSTSGSGSDQDSNQDGGAFRNLFISLTPTKNERKSIAVTDSFFMMSPARRSIRLAEKGVKCSAEKYVVSSLSDLPAEVNFSVQPNTAIL